jgi:hypothetical protein
MPLTLRAPLQAALLLALGCVASGARAEPSLALRLGVAPAVGSAARDVPASDVIPVQFPLQLDALWKVGPFAAGFYGSWGPGRAGSCGPGTTCSARDWRVGLQATWTFATQGGSEPWAGLASGYEWAIVDRTHGGTIETTLRGFEPIAIQGGIEWRIGRWLALGPYGLVGIGRYTKVSVDTGFGAASEDVPDRAVHAWLHAGVRGRLVLGGGR